MKHVGDELDKSGWTEMSFIPGKAGKDLIEALGLNAKHVNSDPIQVVTRNGRAFIRYGGLIEVSRETWDQAVALYLTALDVNT